MAVYVAEHAATTKAPLATASKTITDPANYPKWFKGARDVAAGDAYPKVGATLSWNVAWGATKSKFSAKVVENDLPHRLVQRVKTPSGESVITHTFEKVAGGTRYSKRVEVQDAGFFLRLMMGMFLPRSVRNEVEAAARLADEAHGER